MSRPSCSTAPWSWTASALALLLAGFPGGTLAQGAGEVDPLAPLHQLVGTWDGSISGSLGTGTGIREYELILDGKFLMLRHGSVRQPQPESPSGDHHREISIFSYDAAREMIVMRAFYVEGAVARYVCDVNADPLVVDCEDEAIENGGGLASSVRIIADGPHAFVESFELRGPGADDLVSMTIRWTRRPVLPG